MPDLAMLANNPCLPGNRGRELWRQRNALQGNPYLQMGGP
jgi:hypothetical protein